MKTVETYRCPRQHEFRVAAEGNSDVMVRKCRCGQKARVVRIVWGESLDTSGDAGHIYVKNRPYQYGKWNVPSIGRFVRSDAEQDRLYGERIRDARKRAAEARKSCSRKGDVQWELVGKTPLEVHESVVENENDRHAWNKDPEKWLKKTGTWVGE